MASTATHIRTRGPVPAGQTWTTTTIGGHIVTGHLPEWAEDDPTEGGIPLELLGTRLADIAHHTTFPGQRASIVLGSVGPTYW